MGHDWISAAAGSGLQNQQRRAEGRELRPRTRRTKWPNDQEAAKRRGFVYFARTKRYPTLIKIGFSAQPKRRLEALRREHSLDLEFVGIMVGSLLLERQMHHKFQDLRVTAEWFSAEPKLMTHIESLTYDDEFNEKVGELLVELYWPEFIELNSSAEGQDPEP